MPDRDILNQMVELIRKSGDVRMMQYFEYIYSRMHIQLNRILTYLQENCDSSYLNRTKSRIEIHSHIQKNFWTIGETYDSSEHLVKLIKDGYIQKQLANGVTREQVEHDSELRDIFEYYDLTKKGARFINKGGYKPPKVKVTLSKEQKREKRRDKIDRYKLWHLRYFFLALVLSGIYFVLRIFGIDLIELTKNTIRGIFQ